MEIQILLSDVVLGPYTEEQVRRYLAEGHLLPTDLARHEGIEDWITLDQLLAQLPSSSREHPPLLQPTSSPEPAQVQSQPADEPVGIPVWTPSPRQRRLILYACALLCFLILGSVGASLYVAILLMNAPSAPTSGTTQLIQPTTIPSATPTQAPTPTPTPSPTPTPNPTPTPSPTPTPTPDRASAKSYAAHGDAKSDSGDLDGAIADYTQALEIDPQLAIAANNRGLARQAKGDLDGAIADYTHAIELNPKLALAYRNLGLAQMAKGNFNDAVTDATKSLGIDPNDALDYYNRGLARLATGDLNGALSDLQEYVQISPADDFYSHYAHLYIWVIDMQLKNDDKALNRLSVALGPGWSPSSHDTATKLAEFLLGELNEADLIASASSQDQKEDAQRHCEVWYFVGMKRLLGGNKSAGIDAFRKCVATREINYCEYILAQAELKALGASNVLPSAPLLQPGKEPSH